MDYVMKENVLHNGVKLEKGKLCPQEFVKELSKEGLLSEFHPKVKPEPQVVAPPKEVKPQEKAK